MTHTPDEEYAADLREILEFRGVPTEAATQIVREVQSHVAESGEDPVAAFGTPGEYADSFAPKSRMARFWMLILSSVILAFGGTYVLITGVFALQAPGHDLWGLPPWIRIAVGAAGIASFIALVLLAGARSKRRSLTWHI
ncbi:hypothetical protein GCM10023081_18380 [Arthrobacter ginkgonis]|uniref:DUF1707 domain-containing protein n=1 Tax=Arthrobacter ginkgonis TaxID=1630594 RepID=A0ABP7CA42_9MICC